MRPALEKSLSELTDVAGMAWKIRAKDVKSGNWVPFFRHHSKISTSREGRSTDL
jgi:hypothetical protein